MYNALTIVFSQEVVVTLHGFVSSCVGPILDVSMNSKLFLQERHTIDYFTVDVFLPSVYDTLLVTRSSSTLREGTVVRYLHTREYLSSIAFNDSYLFSFLHLIPANYSIITANFSFFSRQIIVFI